jgi:hypothetical protein
VPTANSVLWAHPSYFRHTRPLCSFYAFVHTIYSLLQPCFDTQRVWQNVFEALHNGQAAEADELETALRETVNAHEVVGVMSTGFMHPF